MEISGTENSAPASFADDDRPDIEYRSALDGAWYSVELVLLHDVLVVRYKEFPSEYDEVFPASEHFSSSVEIGQFAERFRPSFEQMQDSECPTVAKGTEVCALCHSTAEEVKFYDAIVVQVDRTRHGHNEKGEEVCKCSFLLSWKSGPLVGKVTCAKIEDICLRPKNSRVDPILLLFLKKAKDQLPEHSHNVLVDSSGTSPHKYGLMNIIDSLKSPPHQQQLPTNNLDFYSVQRARRKGRFASRTA
ncbi:PREDICTED: protein SAWADEE HOMEODOMAIN HOMOLOG 2 isoform X2 [Tarenaya hassleriana]|uniref:protein SAWADEE HOMEODOMAIN HOMOLOG 2 isoform X2 n=1 Tax=Tarenaya hassleriana TaxID=28532 RepID=UPI00053C800B|nr:PREDICTED: protein SAWADEE HOMEODOMAIN HOMOLOG 2 isoform X2 [Tarenaya hassleriana]